MSNAELLYKIIELVVFLTPVAILIWKAASLSAKVNEHEKHLKTHDVQLEDFNNSTDATLATIINSLNEIRISIARLETRFDALEEKSKEGKK